MHQPFDSSFALITFSHATYFIDGDRFWADGVAAKAGIEAVGVVARSSNWFPYNEMKRASEAIRGVLGHHNQIIGYGTSMGGYGAVKYGQMLGMTHALAFAPQWSIDPADVGDCDRRFVGHFDPHVHSSVAIDSGEPAPMTAIVFDPFMKLDKLNFDRILELNPNCVGIRSYFTSHGPIATFAGTEQIIEMFELLRQGKFKGMQVRATQQRRDKRSPIRPLALAQAMVSRNIYVTHRILATHGDKFDKRQKASLHNDMAGVLYERQDFAEAREHSLAATQMCDQPSFHLRLSMVEQKLGLYQSSLAIARKVVQLSPKNAGARIHLSQLLIETDDCHAAIVELNAALNLAPASIAALTLLAGLCEGEERLQLESRLRRIRKPLESIV
jgi:hypothetical protein